MIYETVRSAFALFTKVYHSEKIFKVNFYQTNNCAEQEKDNDSRAVHFYFVKSLRIKNNLTSTFQVIFFRNAIKITQANYRVHSMLVSASVK